MQGPSSGNTRAITQMDSPTDYTFTYFTFKTQFHADGPQSLFVFFRLPSIIVNLRSHSNGIMVLNDLSEMKESLIGCSPPACDAKLRGNKREAVTFFFKKLAPLLGNPT